MRNDGEYRRQFDLMVIGHCLSREELFTRVKSSHMMAEWFEYLLLREEEEAAKYKALSGAGTT